MESYAFCLTCLRLLKSLLKSVFIIASASLSKSVIDEPQRCPFAVIYHGSLRNVAGVISLGYGGNVQNCTSMVGAMTSEMHRLKLSISGLTMCLPFSVQVGLCSARLFVPSYELVAAGLTSKNRNHIIQSAYNSNNIKYLLVV